MADTLAYIPEVIQAHFDEAAYLYSEFVLETAATIPKAAYLKGVEQRLHANLEGLLINAEAAWPLCEGALEEDDPGAFFVAAYLAFHSAELDKVKPVVEAGKSQSALLQAVSYGLAWHPWNNSPQPNNWPSSPSVFFVFSSINSLRQSLMPACWKKHWQPMNTPSA